MSKGDRKSTIPKLHLLLLTWCLPGQWALYLTSHLVWWACWPHSICHLQSAKKRWEIFKIAMVGFEPHTTPTASLSCLCPMGLSSVLAAFCMATHTLSMPEASGLLWAMSCSETLFLKLDTVHSCCSLCEAKVQVADLYVCKAGCSLSTQRGMDRVTGVWSESMAVFVSIVAAASLILGLARMRSMHFCMITGQQ